MTLTINLALDESIQKKKLKDFSIILLNSFDGNKLFRQEGIENSNNHSKNSQNSLMDNSEKIIPINRIIHNSKLNEKGILFENSSISKMQNHVLKTDKLFTTSLIKMSPNIFESSIKKIKMKNGGSLF